jgi:hypothetical protein
MTDDPIETSWVQEIDGDKTEDDRVTTLLSTTDARIWAREFIEVQSSGVSVDEDLMIGWFATAIEVGRIAGERNDHKEDPPDTSTGPSLDGPCEIEIEWTSRYGSTLPDPQTMCSGPCEGMGVYPDMDGYGTKYLHIDDVPFVTCETCDGTGRREIKP